MQSLREKEMRVLENGMGLANTLLDQSRQLQASTDGTGFPSLEYIKAMSDAGFQYVISRDGQSGQFVPKKP